MQIDWSRIPDPTLRQDVVRAGIPLEGAAALWVYPAVHAAWADGQVQRFEHSVVRAGLQLTRTTAPTAWGVVGAWLAERPAQPERLLDLAWRLYECLPALDLTHIEAEQAHFGAWLTTRVSGGFLGFYAMTPEERQALEEIRGYFQGAGAGSERRVALGWGREVERAIPSLALASPEGFEAARGTPLTDPLLEGLRVIDDPALLQALTFASQRSMLGLDAQTLTRKAQRESPKALVPILRELLAGLSPAEREALAVPADLATLTPWPALRLALGLVCQRARNATDRVAVEELLEAHAAGDEERTRALYATWREDLEALAAHDQAPTTTLLRNLGDPAGVELVCRHYVRLVAATYAALKRKASALADTFVVPLFGVHDLRSRQAHAWCLFVDARRGVACALDPTAADAYQDAGHAPEPFNPALDAAEYANLSALLARLLLARQQVGARAAVALVEALDPPARAQAGARVLAQWPASHALSATELERLLAATPGGSPPEAFLTRVREQHAEDVGLFGPARREGLRRGLGALLTAAGWTRVDLA